MKDKITIICILFSMLFLMLFLNCSTEQKKILKGKINDRQVFFEYGIYYTPNSHLNKSDVIDLIQKKYTNFDILDSISEKENVKGSQIIIKEIKNVKEDFTVPDLNFLKYSSHGLSDYQKEVMQKSDFVILLAFFCVESELTFTIEKANRLITELIISDNDILWDSETRESFTKDYWIKNRFIKDKSIDISKHITIHLYPKNDYCRAITLGMKKFGLPDIAIENLSCNSSNNVASLINLTAQTLLDKKEIAEKGKLNIDIDALTNNTLKTELLTSTLENAEKKAKINIVEGVWESGDPENRIIEIGFPLKNPQIKQDALISKIFGFRDEVTILTHDEKLLKASERAKNKIPELYTKFKEGLPIGTHLLIKFPFDNYKNEREWMWVEVIKWNDKTVDGLLQNDPHLVKSLKAGQEVSKNIDDMFDYILYHDDGRQEGNETGKIIAEQYN